MVFLTEHLRDFLKSFKTTDVAQMVIVYCKRILLLVVVLLSKMLIFIY